MGKRKSAAWRKRLEYIARNRRRHSKALCQFCDKRWRRAKTNFYVEKSGACQSCLNYIQTWCNKGAAAVAQRLLDVAVLDSRLRRVPAGKRSLKLVMGGRR